MRLGEPNPDLRCGCDDPNCPYPKPNDRTKISDRMLDTLQQMKSEDLKTTMFGYCPRKPACPIQLHASTVQALIKRGLLEQDGEMEWSTATGAFGERIGNTTPLYRISEAGAKLAE